MAQLNFDASTVAPQEAFDPIPAGWYPAQIVESEMKAGSKPGSAYLAITLQIMGGDFNNRKVFDRFNLQNANPVAVEIAYRSLSAVCHAVGLIQVADSQLLHGHPLMVKVSVRLHVWTPPPARRMTPATRSRATRHWMPPPQWRVAPHRPAPQHGLPAPHRPFPPL